MKRFLGVLLLTVLSIKISFGATDYIISELGQGIYYHQGVHEDASAHNIGAIANVSFVVGNNCVAVIDSGGSYLEGSYLRHAIKDRTNLPICYVINTHVHPDHTFGNAAFKSDNPSFIGHSKLAAAMESRQTYFDQTFKEILGSAYTGTEFISPTQIVETNRPITIDLGNRILTLTAHSTAHTDHDLTVYDDFTKTLWTGDLLFIERVPVMDGSINGWIKVMYDMLSLDLNCVIPGHGSPAHSDWQVAINNQLHYFSLMRDQIRSIIANLGTIDQATQSVGLSETSHWELFEHYHRRNITASFVELEWE
ncbi:MAG: quinoprotein relay system zinc metallohydrolase 2 [Gammaproteobacteria bacterium]|nr:quinoprotein relay system zinc metallohydrolase 2 [Gammaproteobacteria bacterium]